MSEEQGADGTDGNTNQNGARQTRCAVAAGGPRGYFRQISNERDTFMGRSSGSTGRKRDPRLIGSQEQTATTTTKTGRRFVSAKEKRATRHDVDGDRRRSSVAIPLVSPVSSRICDLGEGSESTQRILSRLDAMVSFRALRGSVGCRVRAMGTKKAWVCHPFPGRKGAALLHHLVPARVEFPSRPRQFARPFAHASPRGALHDKSSPCPSAASSSTISPPPASALSAAARQGRPLLQASRCRDTLFWPSPEPPRRLPSEPFPAQQPPDRKRGPPAPGNSHPFVSLSI